MRGNQSAQMSANVIQICNLFKRKLEESDIKTFTKTYDQVTNFTKGDKPFSRATPIFKLIKCFRVSFNITFLKFVCLIQFISLVLFCTVHFSIRDFHSSITSKRQTQILLFRDFRGKL